VALTERLAASISKPSAVLVCTKASTKGETSCNTAPDVTSALPHCETSQQEEGRGTTQREERRKFVTFLVLC